MSDQMDLLTKLMLCEASAAEHYIAEVYRHGYHGATKAWMNMVNANEQVKAQRKVLAECPTEGAG